MTNVIHIWYMMQKISKIKLTTNDRNSRLLKKNYNKQNVKSIEKDWYRNH